MERLLLLFAVAFGAVAHAQNLVPNGSFEEYSDCPPYFGYSFLATGWGGPGGVWFNSPDYFNACDESNVVGIPSSQFGYQFASDGQAYMGMITSESDAAYREFIGAQLIEPLEAGVPVCLSFRMAVGGFGSFTGNSPFNTCKNFGLKFFVQPPTEWEDYLYPNSAAIRIEELPTDTAEWYSVSDEYVPDSDYVYVVLGNFFNDSLSEITLLDSTGFGVQQSYAFVDDVRVSFDLSYCSSENAIGEFTSSQPVVYPNPVTDHLNLVLRDAQGSVSFTVSDLSGRVVHQETKRSTGPNCRVDISDLPHGTYLLCLDNRSDVFAPVRFVHIAE